MPLERLDLVDKGVEYGLADRLACLTDFLLVGVVEVDGRRVEEASGWPD